MRARPLSASYELARRDIRHVVLERDRIGASWAELWDGFRTNTPRGSIALAGMRYDGPRPEGFCGGPEIAAILERYARDIAAPVRCATPVRRVTTDDGRFTVHGDDERWTCRAVIVAVGQRGRRRLPRFAGRLPTYVAAIHAADYRNASRLAAGVVLVVGGGQTGVQIAEDLRDAGREVYLCLAERPSNVRRFRGRDYLELWETAGILHAPLTGPREPSEGVSPLVSGTGDGGRTITPKLLSERGIRLLGRLREIAGDVARFDDLGRQLRSAAAGSRKLRRELAEIARRHYAPEELEPSQAPDDLDWAPDEQLDELDLRAAGVRAAVLCGGFEPDWSWLELPRALDDRGNALGARGISPQPGLYFLGLARMRRISSTSLCNAGVDAREIVDHLERRLAAR